MSRSRHHGNDFRRVEYGPEFPGASTTVYRTHSWGHTQRGRRRHRTFWSRVLARQRRAWDRAIIQGETRSFEQ